MTHRITLEPTFVLHRRPFSNSSWILDVLTKNFGRLSLLARNARGLHSRYRGQLEMFCPMLVDFSGRRELKTVGQVEFVEPRVVLEGESLLCGLYLNELMSRLIPPHDPYSEVFEMYHHALLGLFEAGCDTQKIQGILRCFEKKVLVALGYGLSFTKEADTGSPVEPDVYYQYIADRGFLRHDSDNQSMYSVFIGSSLLALHAEQLVDSVVLSDAKRLMRLVLPHYLGPRPLKSRDLLK